MAGPSWLASMFASAMIAISVYCLTRLAASWRLRRPTDHRVDGMHVYRRYDGRHARASAAVFSNSGSEVIFAASVAWFGWLAIRDSAASRQAAPAWSSSPASARLRAMLYMFLAAATVAKAAAGGAAISGIAGARTSRRWPSSWPWR